jgi:GNAT superfamily N-acetyltransferase
LTPVAAPYGYLAAVRPGEAFLAWEVVPESVESVWGAGDAVAWVAPSAYHGKRWLTALGAAEVTGALATDGLASPHGDAIAGLSLPDGAFAYVPEALRPRHVERWTWWSTTTAPPHAEDPAVVTLDGADPRLPALLDQSGSVYLRPGDPRVRAWFGLVEGPALRACLAVERHHPQVPHLASVVVDRSMRGRSYGTRLCGTVVTGLLRAGAPVVSLAMMTDNRAAAALYRSLGFATGPSFVSGTIPDRRGLPQVPGWHAPIGGPP